VQFAVSMPGLMRYPPDEFPPGSDRWEAHMTCADFQRVARACDDLGFDALLVSEHLALPVDLVAQMGAHWSHGLTAMAFIAGATSRIRVNSMAIVLPSHHPLDFAKALTTLDVMSGGRAMATLGVGMAPAELRAVGVPYERRGRVTDEYLAAMQALWSEDRPRFAGELVQFDDIVFEPKPVQRPHPPLWFGGRTMASLRRAATQGDGWAPSGGLLGRGPWFEGPEQLPEVLAQAWAWRRGAGVDRPFDVFVSVVRAEIGPGHTVRPPTFEPTSAQEIVDEVGRLATLGVTWTLASRPGPPSRSLDAFLDDLAWVADEVVAPTRGS
jgi:probable F420-dependent oxidoreductase